MPCPVFLKSLPHPCPVFLRRSRREVPGSGPSLRKLSIKKLPGGALNLPGRAFCQPPRGPKTLVGAGYGARASEAKTELPGSCPEITGQLPRKPRRPPREVPGRFGPTSRLGSTLRWLSGHFPTRPRYQQIPYPGQGRLGPEPWPGAAQAGEGAGRGRGPHHRGVPDPMLARYLWLRAPHFQYSGSIGSLQFSFLLSVSRLLAERLHEAGPSKPEPAPEPPQKRK